MTRRDSYEENNLRSSLSLLSISFSCGWTMKMPKERGKNTVSYLPHIIVVNHLGSRMMTEHGIL
eukprot:CAMPEP_0194048584 /NCGR_PEP_ID=MMETSP0009_2-20130614/27780_1 /TAXON_ID=210454 /ORGANISM="Grammatophora oceanica, Strain CCMP 410" /LENGTH=63 /DNA_ID=CAMNT_0038694503 /DNA_START=76 /DNA_END=264 /DNA_ORIENTATION=-